MSTLTTRIDGRLFTVTSRDNGMTGERWFEFGDYIASRPDELSRVMVYGELDVALPENVATAVLCEFGSENVTLARLEWQARGTVNGKRVVFHDTSACMECGKTSEVILPYDVWNNWYLNGNPIQIAWPDAHPEIRELLISGTHGKCWKKLIGEDD